MKHSFFVGLFCLGLMLTNGARAVEVSRLKIDSVGSVTSRVLRNNLVEITVQLDGVFVNFEITGKNKKFKVQIASEQGKLAFSDKQCIIAYQANAISKVS